MSELLNNLGLDINELSFEEKEKAHKEYSQIDNDEIKERINYFTKKYDSDSFAVLKQLCIVKDTRKPIVESSTTDIIERALFVLNDFYPYDTYSKYEYDSEYEIYCKYCRVYIKNPGGIPVDHDQWWDEFPHSNDCEFNLIKKALKAFILVERNKDVRNI